MDISDYSFHDSIILEIREYPDSQTVDIYLDFPVDWNNYKFEHRIWRFNDVINYTIKSLPRIGPESILETKEFGTVKYQIGTGTTPFNAERNKIIILTNGGDRTIEYTTCELLTIN